MESRLYLGHVGHQRSAPVPHGFGYQLFFLYLDLAELEEIFAGRWFWSVEGPNWASFRRADHLKAAGVPLDVAVRDEVQRQLGRRPAGPIRLLTHLRYLGYCFNPISVYYCFARDGRTLEAVLTEVHNTPWGEEYLRAFDTLVDPPDGEWFPFRFAKEFHVSPFMPMEINYHWRFTVPGERLALRMTSLEGGTEIFNASLELHAQALGGASLARALLRWPFMTAKVIAAIYWQALRLKLKGVPFCPHPEQVEIKKGGYTP